jgi:diacylglycerol kinase (ATP)
VNKRALVLLNDQARQVATQAKEVFAWLREHGFSLVVPSATDRLSIRRAIRVHRDNVDLVIAGGGDGTLNAVLQGLIHTSLPLGIVPLGTANDLARSLGIPLDPEQACSLIAGNDTRVIDVGMVNGVYFFNEASIGLTVSSASGLSKDEKAKLGIAAVLMAILRTVRHARRFQATVRCDDGRQLHLRTAQLTIVNSKSFGGLVHAPDASLDDRKLDLYSVAFEHLWDYFSVLGALVRQNYRDAKGIVTLQGRGFDVTTYVSRSIEADGEVVSRTPARFTIVPNAITVFAPPREENSQAA